MDGKRTSKGPAEERPRVCCLCSYGLTGESCSRLFDPSVAKMARMIPGTSFSRTLDSPGGNSEDRLGSPAACAAAEDAMARPTAPPSKLVVIVGLRIGFLQQRFPVRVGECAISQSMPGQCDAKWSARDCWSAKIMEQRLHVSHVGRIGLRMFTRSDHSKLESLAAGPLSSAARLGECVTYWMESRRSQHISCRASSRDSIFRASVLVVIISAARPRRPPWCSFARRRTQNPQDPIGASGKARAHGPNSGFHARNCRLHSHPLGGPKM
jgi:hypothetical protein